MSWLWRGFQSAVFYYVSCAPCTQMAYRRRRRKGAARSKHGEEMDQSLYPHPSPFTTNVYWREEMALGPGPPQKKKDREKERQQRSKGGHRDLMTGNSNDTGTSSADTMVATSSLQGVAEMEQERRSEEGWNRRRYQREDESLWGLDDGSEDGHPFTETYCTARNPEVNDLHPPVVSTQPTHRSETRWMLQPPPSAKVMEGKERALRSRSGSGGSNGSSRRGVIGLGRQIGERMVEKKRKEGQAAPEASSGSAAMSRATSRESTDPTRGQRHDRDAPVRVSTDTATSAADSFRGGKPEWIDIPSPSPASSTDPLPPRSRPPLPTIISSTAIPPFSPTTTSPPSPSTSPLRALQELTPLNARPAPSSSQKLNPPPRNDTEDLDPHLTIPEIESFWPPPPSPSPAQQEQGGFHRWSCDI
ncbi:MAG: hypothetical protein LQ345_002267 [Seirophora villosa]|nr:MAG: hypothetical protein LQ345_002267 [Seirophora villosa]